MNIFDISKELDDIINELIESGGVITDELAEKLAISEETLHAKLKSYSYVIKQMEANDVAITEEITRLEDRKEVNKKAIAKLENIITDVVNRFGNPKKAVKGIIPEGKVIDLGTIKFSTSKSTKCNILQESLIPLKYRDATIKLDYDTYSKLKTILLGTVENEVVIKTQVNNAICTSLKLDVSKSKIKEDLESNIEIIGAELSKDYNIKIK